MVAKILEVAMLILFGISWPVSLYKTITSKSTKGKSLIFLIFIDAGYVCGILSKIFSTSFVWENDWWIFAMYVLNFTMVSTDLVLYFVNLSREKKH